MSVPGITPRLRGLSPAPGQVTYVLLTRSPLSGEPKFPFVARLAFVKYAASVCPEPGSNSPKKV